MLSSILKIIVLFCINIVFAIIFYLNVRGSELKKDGIKLVSFLFLILLILKLFPVWI